MKITLILVVVGVIAALAYYLTKTEKESKKENKQSYKTNWRAKTSSAECQKKEAK